MPLIGLLETADCSTDGSRIGYLRSLLETVELVDVVVKTMI